jgi:hypothetical protein
MPHSAASPALTAQPLQQSLSRLLESMDPDADRVHRHLWLISLFDWIRGSGNAPETAPLRMNVLLDAAEANPALTIRLQVWCASPPWGFYGPHGKMRDG